MTVKCKRKEWFVHMKEWFVHICYLSIKISSRNYKNKRERINLKKEMNLQEKRNLTQWKIPLSIPKINQSSIIYPMGMRLGNHGVISIFHCPDPFKALINLILNEISKKNKIYCTDCYNTRKQTGEWMHRPRIIEYDSTVLFLIFKGLTWRVLIQI